MSTKTSVDVGGITKGKAYIRNQYPNTVYVRIGIADCTLAQFKQGELSGTFSEREKQATSNAALYAEAQNVANECGRSPRQLLEERDRAVELLRISSQAMNVVKNSLTSNEKRRKLFGAIEANQAFLQSLNPTDNGK